MDKSLRISVAPILALLISCPVYAQVADQTNGSGVDGGATSAVPTSEPDAAPTAGLGEIVVTAQRRTENLQRVAVPIDVISADAITASGAVDPTGLTSLAPGLSATPNGGGAISFFVRGVGNFSANPLFEPAIAFNYDNVYIGRAAGTAGLFYDLQRVEVLKGPQGTLYGRNATGGAVNVLPNHPTLGGLSGFVTASYGNYDAFNAQGAINIPLSSTTAARVSGAYNRHDGYLSDGTADQDEGGVRFQVLSELTPSLTARFSFDYQHIGGSGQGASYANAQGYNAATNSFFVQNSNLDRSVGIYDPRSQAFRATIAEQVSGRFLAPLDGARPFVDIDSYGAHAQFDYESDLGTLTVIPSWRQLKTDTLTVVPGFLVGLDNKDEQYAVEARFDGNRIGAFEYTLGALYFHESNDSRPSVNQQTLFSSNIQIQKTNSYAVFARLNAHLTDSLRLVGGVRFTHDKKSFQGDSDTLTVVCVVPSPAFPRCPNAPQFTYSQTASGQTVPLPVPGAPPLFLPAAGTLIVRSTRSQDARLSKGKVTYRLAAEYDVTDQSLLYASFETGFRSGGFSIATGYETYDPETLDAWTVGSKNRFFDNRLQLNVEGYYWKYRDQQLARIAPDLAGNSANFTTNIGKATMYGADIEARLAVMPTFIVNAQLQYLHTKYDSFEYDVLATSAPRTGCATRPSPAGATLIRIDCAGKSSLNAPKWTLNLGAEKTFEVGGYEVVASADTQYRSSRFVGFEFLESQFQPSTWQTNAEISVGPTDGNWTIAGFARNIENNRYIMNAQYFNFGRGVSYVTASPATYGVRGTVRF